MDKAAALELNASFSLAYFVSGKFFELWKFLGALGAEVGRVIFEIKWNHDGNAVMHMEQLRVTPERLLSAPPLILK